MGLESANFQAASIRKTSSAIKLRTDASMRFEKSQDPARRQQARDRGQVAHSPELTGAAHPEKHDSSTNGLIVMAKAAQHI